MNDYIKSMRALIGKETLLTIGCGAIIEDASGNILLQLRKDKHSWCLPGGVMELGETCMETAAREVLEETGLIITNAGLFGIYSGAEGFAEYKNGDKVFSVQIIFHTKQYEGNLIQESEESAAHRFFARSALPSPLNPHQARFIIDWAEGKQPPIIS